MSTRFCRRRRHAKIQVHLLFTRSAPRFSFSFFDCVSLGMPRGRGCNIATISLIRFGCKGSVLQPRSGHLNQVEAGSTTCPATAQDSRPSPGREGVHGPRSDCQVGSRDRSRWRRRRDGAQVEGGFEESPSTGADSPRTIFGQSPQECVEGARGSLQGQQFLMEAQKRHEERGRGYRGRTKVDIADRGCQPCCDHEGPHSGFRPSRLGGRVGRIATEGKRIGKHFRGSCKRQAVSVSVPADRPGPRLKEDFVLGCDDDIFRWMQDRQPDIQEATWRRKRSRARLCHVMGSEVAGWSTPSLLPSMACNAVR